MGRFIKYYLVYVLAIILFGLIDKYGFHDKVDIIGNRITAIAILICWGLDDIRKEFNKFS